MGDLRRQLDWYVAAFRVLILADLAFIVSAMGKDNLRGIVQILLTNAITGIQVDGISLSPKKVTLKGFNGLKDGVKIKSFDLPANDPAGGIHLTIEADATNVSSKSHDDISNLTNQ